VSAFSFVVQEMVAPAVVIALVVTAEMTGAVVSAGGGGVVVVIVTIFERAEMFPAASLERIAAVYVVPPVRPASVYDCAVPGDAGAGSPAPWDADAQFPVLIVPTM
jgi:hypothetical protein